MSYGTDEFDTPEARRRAIDEANEPMLVKNIRGIASFLDWAAAKGLDVEEVSCGSCTVKLRERALAPIVVKASDLEEIDDDSEEEERLPPPRDSYAEYARQLGVKK